MNHDFDDWVLGGIARDICNRGKFDLVSLEFRKGKSLFQGLLALIMSQELIFINQDTFFKVSKFFHRILSMKSIRVLYTHTDPNSNPNWKVLADARIVCLNKTERNLLIANGISSAQIVVCPTGVDFAFFNVPPIKPEFNRVLLVSNYKERKNPSLMLEVIAYNLDFNFTLIGRGWEYSEIFDLMLKLPNFTYLEFTFPTYLECLEKNHIFLSLSTLEGGPLPMLETMACNLIPVCIATGWVTDLIQHGQNGYILSKNCSIADVREFLLSAMKRELNTRNSIKQYSYERYLNNFLS